MNFGKEKGMMAENHVKWMEQSFTFCFCCFDMLLSLFFFNRASMVTFQNVCFSALQIDSEP